MQAWRLQVEKDASAMKLRLDSTESPIVAVQTWSVFIAERLRTLKPSQRYAIAYAADLQDLDENNDKAAMQLLQRCLMKVLTRRHFSGK